jgi:hypothetical protein
VAGRARAQDGHGEGVMEGSDGARQAEVFLQQAEHCRDFLRSPLYAELCERCAHEPLVAAVAPDLRWDLPLRLLAALHYLSLAGRAPALAHAYADGSDAWPAFRAALEAEQEFVARFLREQAVQTNEVQRCTGLMLGFLLLARESGRRLDLVELGPSAGLNLLWDRYRYRFGAAAWGPEDSPLTLEGELRAPLPDGLLATQAEVGRRVGIDLNPLDPRVEETSLLLRSFVWADQPERAARVEQALAVARRDPPEVLRGDYRALLPHVLADRDPDALTVVFETASLIYLPREEQERVAQILAEAGEDGALAFLWTTQPDSFGLRLRTWPGGEERFLAEVDPHGAWVRWQS